MAKGFSNVAKGKPERQNKVFLERKLAGISKNKPLDPDAIIKLHLSGDLKGAEQGYRYLISQKTANDIIYANLAAICLTSDRVPEGIELLQRSLKLNPHNLEALNSLGNVWHNQGNFAEAIASYHRVIELNPNYASAHYNLVERQS